MRESVREYYGKTLSSSDDLQTNACCDQSLPGWLKPVLSQLHEDVVARYYGCGLVLPQELEGARVLDLGCGSGRDVYLLSALVGENGHVTGVDMTEEQLAVARQYSDYHRDAFGYGQSNARFLQGEIEKLQDLALQDASFDIVVSNCVLNLCLDKAAVLREVRRVLKPGGEFYFSDIYADRRIPPALRDDPVLHGECLSGALYWHDFLDIAKAAGFADPRLVESRPVTIDNDAIKQQLGEARFYSATYRLFNIEALETACEDYGQTACYRGTAAHCPEAFVLDEHHTFVTGETVPVCGNTWRMITQSRLGRHFDATGDFSSHKGLFPDCGMTMPFAQASPGSSSCC